jgi:hypothetical protein|nr:MAG TPA: hypothetical protein [Caudoviricetes sp.]
MRDPGQIAFCRVRKIIEDMFGKFSIYDTVLPEVGTSYPFFYIGESFQSDELLKNSVVGTINLTVHYWSDKVRARGTAVEDMRKFKSALYESEDENTQNDETKIHFLRANSRILADNSTAVPLLHGVIELYFSFS